MSSDIVSRKTRIEFREYFVSTSLAVIRDEFDAADIALDANYTPNIQGARRSLVEQYYKSIDWTRWADVRKFLAVYENVLANLETYAGNGSEEGKATLENLRRWIERDGFSYQQGRLIPTARQHSGLHQLTEAAKALNLPEIHRQIQRIRASIDEDPALAIGTAKELVETVCKTILDQRGVACGDDADIGQLVKETRKALGLIPDSIPNAAKGVESIRRLLSNLGNIAQVLGELRNLYGTGHGKSGTVRGLSARHARLAVGAADTLASFLIETHQDRGIV